MDRWGVPDEVALKVIDGPARARSGARPRFRLQGAQVDTYDLLRGIDRHLEDLRQAPNDWLARTLPGGQAPLDLLAREGAACLPDLLRALELAAFQASLGGPKSRRTKR